MEMQYEVKKLHLAHREQARLLGVELPDDIAKKAGFESVFDVLRQPGRELNLCQWFVWRVYRHLDSNHSVLVLNSTVCEEITDIANLMIADVKLIKSVKRYEGGDLRWFGDWTAPSGHIAKGGSKQTLAFKSAAAELEKFVVRDDIIIIEKSSSTGCASVIALFSLVGYFGNVILTNVFY